MAKTITDYLNEIEERRTAIRQLRAEERSLSTQEKVFLTEPLIKRNELRDNLANSLPKNLVPSNVGELEQLVWNFEYPLRLSLFDGVNSILLANKIYEMTEQVGQESCFILTGITRSFTSFNNYGKGLPAKFLIRDRQSSRQIMDKPISLAHVAHSGKVLKLATPYLFMPNARITVELSSMLGSNMTFLDPINQLPVDAELEITLLGVRCRTSDVKRIIEAMYL
jgi:hypothetical protein